MFAFLVKGYINHLHIDSTPVPMVNCRPTSGSDKEVLGVKLRKLSTGILELQRNLYTSSKHFNALGSQVEILDNMLKFLKHGSISKSAASTRQEVCRERFGTQDIAKSAPYYRFPNSHASCKAYVPIYQLITILIYLPQQLPKPAMNYAEIMEGVAKYYPDIRVVLATSNELPEHVLDTISTLRISFKNVAINSRKGNMWANLLTQVETPYVLIAPYITHFDDDIDLYRLLRILSYRDDVSVAGGSYRNLSGHWDLGCRQVSFNYWTAKYSSGYYRSFNECTVCDYLPGPFAAKTELLKKLKFDSR
jgi:hypothetical protein